jgi:hypothetical protein
MQTPGPPDKAASIRWIEPPVAGNSVVLEFYLAPQPPYLAKQWKTPFPIVSVLPLEPHGSLVVLRNHEVLDDAKLRLIASVRQRIEQLVANPPPGTNPPIRGALWIEFEDHTRGFIEIAPHGAAA